mgnify:FL=1
MTVTATENSTGNVVIFRWNNELTECNYTTGGLEFDEVDDLLDRMMLCGTHKGNDYKGWEVKLS